MLACLAVEPTLQGYYLKHPVSTSALYLAAIFGGQVPNPEIFAAWKLINIGIIAIIIALIMYYKMPEKDLVETQSDLLGSSRWMNPSEKSKKFCFEYSPGILFGQVGKKPLILPADADANRNVAVFGPPGTGKSRAYVRNNLFQAVTSGWSVIVTDPKGELVNDFYSFFKERNYITKIFNLVDMKHSDRWNPLNEIKTDLDAQVFCEVVVANTSQYGGKKGGDPFWDRAELNLFKALVLYTIYELPKEERNLGSLYKLLAPDDPKYIDSLFTTLPHDHVAKMPYNIYAGSSAQVRASVLHGLGTRLAVFQDETVRKLTETSDFNLSNPGLAKCAYFCIVSDTDRTFSFLSSLYFSFLFINLTRTADRQDHGVLPVPVNFLLDEFCNIGNIPDFTQKLSTMRGRGIGCSIIFQSIPQLNEHYPAPAWETIIANCSTWLILGIQEVTGAKYVSDFLGYKTILVKSKTRKIAEITDFGSERKDYKERRLLNPDEIIRMPRDEALLLVAENYPMRLKKMDYTKNPMCDQLKPSPLSKYRPQWSFPEDYLHPEPQEDDVEPPTKTVLIPEVVNPEIIDNEENSHKSEKDFDEFWC